MPTQPRQAPDGASAALAAHWHLAVVAGPDPGWCLAVGREPRSVGRDPACDLTLVDPSLSRRHLEVRSRRGVVEVRDLGSANGTRVRMARRGVPRRGGLRSATWERPLGARWRMVTPGSDVLLGGTVIRVRMRPGLEPSGARRRSRPLVGGARLPARPRAAGMSHARGGTVSGAAPAPRSGPRSTRWATSLLLAASSLPLLLASGASGGRLALFAAVPVLLALAGGAWGRGPRASSPPPADPAGVLVAAVAGGGLGFDGAAPAAGGDTGSWAVSTPGHGLLDPFTDGPVALVGEPAATDAAARWLVCQLAVAHPPDALRIDLQPQPLTPSWSWGQELRHAHGVPTRRTSGASDRLTATGRRQSPRTLVVEASGPYRLSPGEVSTRYAPGSATGIVVLVPTVQDVPVWCRRVIEVSPDDHHQVSAAWAQHVVTSLARHATTTTSVLPSDVPITSMLPDPFLAWAADDGRLAAAFSHDGDGPVEVDLARDGPHALVAGTTGSGKSELLLCWVLALACRYPPSALTVVAIDYKGGATFGSLVGLPHLAGMLTDLDGAGTARALAGLQAELERRERLLAAAGARDLSAYRRALAAPKGRTLSPSCDRDGDGDGRPAPLGRLLVVVDEFRVLAEEHPDLMAGLVRTAAQGRSLGIHLVLATQRPAGALSADLRANLTVALCLRVLTAADSHDVIGSGDAAALPPVPGRAILHGGHRLAVAPGPVGAVTVQGAWSGPEDDVRRAVHRAAAAADRSGEPSAEPLWAPPLPVRAVASNAGEPATTGALPALPTLLVDRPAERRLVEWAWEPSLAPLLVAGAPGTGRTAALQTVVGAALGRGLAVHVAHGGDRGSWGAVPGPAHPRLGTVVGADDPRRLVRLLDLLHDIRGPAILCVDDVDAVVAACDRMSGPPGTERLGRLLRDSRARAIGVAVAGPLAVLGSRWAEVARHRIVLGPLDGGQAALAGVPRALVLDRPVAGRAVLLGDGPGVHAQVLLPTAPRPPAHPSTDDRARPRLRVLPLQPSAEDVLGQPEPAAQHAGAARRGVGTVPLGVGDDDAGVILLELPPGARVAVVGPPESGRTSALQWIRAGLQRLGRCAIEVRPGMPGTDDVGSDAAILVDDADLLGQDEADAAARRWRDHAGVVVVAARSGWLATGYGALVGLLRGARIVLVLAPLRGGCAHLSAADVLPHADPVAPRHPGRGVLVGPRRCVPIQLPAPPAPGLPPRPAT